MLVLLALITLIELIRNDLLYAEAVLASERIVLAVTLVVHVVGTDVPADVGVFVAALEFVAFGVAVVLEGDGVVGEAACFSWYPLLLAVRLTPRFWFWTLYSSRYFSFCW